MSKLNNVGLSLKAFNYFAETDQKVKNLLNSKLNDEEKIKALVSFKKARKTRVVFISIMSAILALLLIVGFMSGVSNN